jgi:hypothetical protein
MTSTEIEAVYKDWDTPTEGCASRVLMGMNTPTEVATLRATLEVAYQLALLNENFNEMMGNLFNNRNTQIRVMVEPGDWPIQTQEQRR